MTARLSTRNAQRSRSRLTSPASVLALGAGAAVGAYLATAGLAWAHFGRVTSTAGTADCDDLLDRFIPQPDVAERHHIQVNAPAAVTLEAARAIDISSSGLARAIFKGREWVMQSHAGRREPSRGFVADMQALGWGVLAEVPDRELVMGGVTRPWEANPVFRALPPEQFESFAEPGYVKIAFTLRADPLDDGHAVFRTETRAQATDAAAREKFRTYWAFLSPGIVLIRWSMLRPVKRSAERAFKAG